MEEKVHEAGVKGSAFALLREDSPFVGIFVGNLVPIVSTIAVEPIRTDGRLEHRSYFVDWARCSPPRRERMVTMLTALSGRPDGVMRFAQHLAMGGDLPLDARQVLMVQVDLIDRNDLGDGSGTA